MKRTATKAVRLVVFLTAVFAGLLATASEIEPQAKSDKPKAGMGRYVVVLWEPGTPIPGGNGTEHLGKIAEPDFTKMGGTVLSSVANRRVVDLPVKEAGKLKKHRAVAMVQRLWTGEPYAELKEEPEGSNSRRGLATESDTNLDWGPKAYQYDGSGNIKAIGPDSFAYDTAGRLIQSTVGGKTETFKYDAFGNLIEKAVAGANPVTIPVDGGSNRIIGGSYDANGNVTRGNGGKTYSYDATNMMTAYSGQGGRQMVYDADDERIGVIMDISVSRWWIRDQEGKVLREYQATGRGQYDDWLWEQDWVYGEGQLVGGERVPFSMTNENGQSYEFGGKRHYHLDHLGSVRMVSDDSGRSVSEHDYYAFGVTPTKAYQEQINWGDPHIDAMRFAGHQREFLGSINTENTDYLDYMHARYYDPNLGRFLSVDPLLDVKRSTREPQSWNRYSYVVNNPINRIDPDGRMDGNGMGEPVEWRCPGCTRAEALEQSNQIAAGTAKGAAVSLSLMAGGAGVYAFATNAAFRFSVLMNLTGIGIGVTGGAVAGSGQIHHIATNKNIAGGFTKQFEAIFTKAGMKLGDSANLMNLSGHAGRHSPGYHKHVLDTLQKATHGLSGKAYKEALTGALNTLRKELEANPDLVKMR